MLDPCTTCLLKRMECDTTRLSTRFHIKPYCPRRCIYILLNVKRSGTYSYWFVFIYIFFLYIIVQAITFLWIVRLSWNFRRMSGASIPRDVFRFNPIRGSGQKFHLAHPPPYKMYGEFFVGFCWHTMPLGSHWYFGVELCRHN